MIFILIGHLGEEEKTASSKTGGCISAETFKQAGVDVHFSAPRRLRQAELCEFKASPHYLEGSSLSRAMQRDSFSKNQNETKQNKTKTEFLQVCIKGVVRWSTLIVST